MRVKRLRNIRTRKNIVTLKGVLCPACHDTGINPTTRLRCRVCNSTGHVRPRADVEMKTATIRSGKNRYIKVLSPKIGSGDYTGVYLVEVIDDCLKEEGLQ